MLATAAEQFHGRVISDRGEQALKAIEALKRGDDVPEPTLDQAITGIDELLAALKVMR